MEIKKIEVLRRIGGSSYCKDWDEHSEERDGEADANREWAYQAIFS